MTEKNTAKELREMRNEIAEVLSDTGYNPHVKARSVSMLSKEGVNFSGPFGARFSVKDGLIVWNKASRYSGAKFSVAELAEIEEALFVKFDELLSTGRLV